VNRSVANKYTVLTIEDEKSVRESIRAHLEDYGYNVLEAENGGAGIDIFKSNSPDAVLVDLKMPGIHGLDVIKIISDMSEITPVIVVSGSGEIESAISAIHNGAADYILKPISDLNILNRSINKCIRNSRERRQELLYRQHLEDELKRKSEEIEKKNRLLSDFNKRLDKIINSAFSMSKNRRLKDMGSYILEDFGSHLQATGGSIYIVEPKGLRLVHTLEPKHSPEFLPFPLKINSPFARVLESGKPILVDCMEAEAGLAPSGWDGYNDSSFMIFPLPDQNGSVMGLLSVHNKTEPPFVSEDREIGLLMSVFCKEANRSMNSIEALHLSESRFRNLSENSAAIIFSYSIDAGRFDYMNMSFDRLTGFSREDVLDNGIQNFTEIMGVIEKEDVISHFENLISGRSSGAGFEYRIVTASGAEKWMFQKTATIFNREGLPVMIDGIITEYSEQKEVEEKLKHLLEQKGILLNEINHRVKNNMQIISSLINLQLESNKDENSRNSLLATENRIASMALVHDNLYDTEFIPSINMESYIGSLVGNLIETRAMLPNINVKLNVSDLRLDLDRAMLCGLIINEAVSNSLLHAFSGYDGGNVTLEFETDGNYFYLNVNDTGSGFDFADINGNSAKGIGLDIIKSLVIQLEGHIEFRRNGGTQISLNFPVFK